MVTIPITEDTLVLRTDFKDDELWEMLCAKVKIPSTEGFLAYVEFISERRFEDVTPENVLAFIPENYNHSIIFLVGADTLAHADSPIICVDLIEKPVRYFGVTPSEMWSVENNLSIANMDFDEFLYRVDELGVFRGF
jgi:hypothetical protein